MTELMVTLQNETLIEDYDYERYMENSVLTVTFLSLSSALGIFGNVHVIIIFLQRYRHSPHRTFIVTLALVDLLVCLLCIPFEAIQLRYEFSFTATLPCKFFKFLNFHLNCCSSSILLAIALERYRKICCAFKRQISLRESKIIAIVIIIVWIIIASPTLAVYGSFKKETSVPGLDGWACTVTNNRLGKLVHKLFFGLLAVIIILEMMVCIGLYSCVGVKLYKHFVQRKSYIKTTKIQSLNDVGGPEIKETSTSRPDANPGEIEILTPSEDKNITVDVTDDTDSKKPVAPDVAKTGPEETDETGNKSNSKSHWNRTVRVSLMLVIATAISFSTYIPLLAFQYFRFLDKKSYVLMRENMRMFHQILNRGYFFNSAINPIIYYLINREFRRKVLLFYKIRKIPWRP